MSARLIARLLDNAIPIPGTSYRIGIDPLLGLVPGVGDAVVAVLSMWLLVTAARHGAPAAVLARMAANIGIDAVVGGIPIAGDLFDAGFKANTRNLRLLEAWLESPAATRRASRARVVVIGIATVLVAGALLFAGWRFLSWVFGEFGA